MAMKKKVYLGEEIHAQAREKLAQYAEIVENLEHIEDLDGIFIRAHRLSRTQLARAKRCKVIARHGVGMDMLDLDACKEFGIPIVFTPYANANAVAEFALSMAMCLMRNICVADRVMRTEGFDRLGPAWLRGRELRGCTVGLVGLGRTGTILAGLYRNGFGCRVLAYDTALDSGTVAQRNAEKVNSLVELVGRCDIVNLCCPLTKETQNLFDAKLFERFNPDAILINTARGPIVDEAALYDALSSGKLRAMGTDVFVDEVHAAQSPLNRLENFIGFPHMAANTDEAMYQMAMTAVEGLMDVLEGRRPTYLYQY